MTEPKPTPPPWRCESCKWWAIPSEDGRPWCDNDAANEKTYDVDAGLGLRTAHDFGCVLWEAKP